MKFFGLLRPIDLRGAFRPILRILILAALSAPGLSVAAGPPVAGGELETAISLQAESNIERDELRAIYDAAGGALLWATPRQRFVFLNLILGLDAHGIDYRKLGPFLGQDHRQLASDDVSATQVVLRASHLMAGNALTVKDVPGWRLTRSEQDAVKVVIEAARQDNFENLLNALAPTAPAYDRLRTAYLHYRRLAGLPWPPIDNFGQRIVEAGDPRLAAIRERLIILGDSSAQDTPEEAFNEEIKRFQTRHGLEPDARIGPATLAELNISPALRVTQIAANLAYWRNLPREWPNHYVVVNAAAAHLEVMRDGNVSFKTRTITGDRQHPTPVMNTVITAVTFNPPWNVPYSIAVNEMLPRLQREATYLERTNIEIVGRTADPYGTQIDWSRYSRTNFPFNFRQPPGAGNALGLVKFEMPNSFNIYLHDTPQRTLFNKSVRALSHGCVRVQCAQELAEHLLNDPKLWLSSDLVAALQEGRTHQILLKQPLPVYLLYFTAFAEESGTVNFRADVYSREDAMQKAISRQR
jgi:murein L,D-transpeptidase YcbB/YkuD